MTPSISAKEAADRKAAAHAWLTYQEVAGDLWKKPAKTWKSTLSKYAVEPILTDALKSLKAGAKAGKGNWGDPIHHVYWQVPIDGGITANLGDCVDASRTGSIDVKTGKKLSVGVAHQNTYVSLVREENGWKVADVTYLPNLACPGQKLSANQEASSMAKAASSSTKATP